MQRVQNGGDDGAEVNELQNGSVSCDASFAELLLRRGGEGDGTLRWSSSSLRRFSRSWDSSHSSVVGAAAVMLRLVMRKERIQRTRRHW